MELDVITTRRARFGTVDWGSIIAAVVSSLALTLLLLVLGVAIGIEAADDGGGAGGTISTALAGWSLAAALIGTIAGMFIGGRFSRWLAHGSAVYHAKWRGA